jgi:Tol biopolymer transport system component
MKRDKYMGMDVHQATTVVAVIDAEGKIVLENRSTLDRFTFDAASTVGILSADGTRVAFNSNQTGPRRLYVRALNSVDATAITVGPEDTPGSWTPDGKEIAFVHGNPEAGSSSNDISLVAVDPPHEIRPLLNDPRFNEIYPEFSPDGRWLAYVSDKSGRREVYVQPYPGKGQPVLISTGGR